MKAMADKMLEKFLDFEKVRMYVKMPNTIHELKVNIRNEFRAIPRSVCKSVKLNFSIRVQKMCRSKLGSHGKSASLDFRNWQDD